MILIEEFISQSEGLLKKAREDEASKASLHRRLLSTLNQIDKLEWETAGEEGEKLRLFVSHYDRFDTLPADRQEKRLANGFAMLDKLKAIFLFPPPLETPSESESQKLKELLQRPVQYVKGVGPRWTDFFNSVDVQTLKDLFFFFPRTYHDRRRVYRVSELFPNIKATVFGTLGPVMEKRTNYGLHILTVTLNDGTGEVALIWYNQPFLKEKLSKTNRLMVTGNVRWTRQRGWEIEVQDYEEEQPEDRPTRTIVPVYRSRKGFPSKSIRKVILNTSYALAAIEDPVPTSINEKRRLIPLADAIYGLHQPKSQAHLQQCRRKMSYNEFFYFQTALLFARRNREEFYTRPAKRIEGTLSERLVKGLPFKLTKAQKRVYQSIRAKLQNNLPVNVLLQGDVGCGKTIVAEMVLLDIIESGFQAAFMAPTAILAQQHFRTIADDFARLDIQPRLLISGLPNKEKELVKEEIRSGHAPLVIGTHALIQEDVVFSRLGLALVDEQHRFGVKQRESLKSKGEQVDTLIMSATPIPRTLALAVYGDLDVETIDETPPGRKAVRTVYIHESKKGEVYEIVRQEVASGNQAFLVFPIIDEAESEDSPAADLKAAVKMFEVLSKGPFKGIPLGLIHGRLKEEEKDAVMGRFVSGEVKVLVATTVIEVGIDVPKATVMVIENPERFGLAQLHQLRGRVGRSERHSYCFLVTNDTSEASEKRLKYFSGCNDGFQLAEYDLQTRGPGDFLGVRQHGMPRFEFGDMVEDANLLYQCREDAQELLSEDIALEKNPKLRDFLLHEYSDKIDRIQTG
ncbi:MAG TPA: ATP-dependent DNA helicase RecG [Thermotogota bacterium]|nr:ATP-dependent DNA helicase RecG [Thermotogota bacterium]NLH19492.1 ATP-dependent DNA helicase RecG [Thermotogaceae bacterium]OQC32407.1 MAG: ATP-dependent DNA helicase RecG [Thermotogota bacterium ADurb.Bin062]HNW47056.1 ATP-dependent DNA helicase RecG [Thermotogota bacterium]HNY81635.1 ATP-dependent DNA helicase RecG [Thermotogota bacterium]